jgi:hypothetical protein
MDAGVVPVRLQYAVTQGGASYARVKVDNLAYAKTVVLHHGDGAIWTDRGLVWVEGYGSYDVFVTPTLVDAGPIQKFAVRYDVSGQRFWDNNGGTNYRIDEGHGTVGGDVTLRNAQVFPGVTRYDRSLRGQIYVNNLAYQKNVGIRMSIDGGATWTNYAASYLRKATEGTFQDAFPVPEVEVWEFSTPLFNPVGNDIYFAVYYDAYWDNNFGRNYRLSPEPGRRLG